jgi:hypothetical protein
MNKNYIYWILTALVAVGLLILLQPTALFLSTLLLVMGLVSVLVDYTNHKPISPKSYIYLGVISLQVFVDVSRSIYLVDYPFFYVMDFLTMGVLLWSLTPWDPFNKDNTSEL